MDDQSTLHVATHYKSSRGELEIATMAYPHIENAIAKMERDGITDPAVHRALCLRRDAINDNPEEAPASAAQIGDNSPPEPTSYEVVKAELEDLRVEAGHWMDGAAVTSQAEADKIGLLRDKIDKAMAQAEKLRVSEKKVHDDAAAEVQNRYNLLIGQTQKVTGIAVTMRKTINTALTAWLNKVAAEQEAIRVEAARVAREAAEAAELSIACTHQTTDLDERDSALADVDRARQAAIDPGNANRAKAQVQTGGRAIGLRSVFRAEITDRIAALAHYKADRLPEYVAGLEAMVMAFANADIKAGKRNIPGVKVHEDRVV